jgi:hypothetical protein
MRPGGVQPARAGKQRGQRLSAHPTRHQSSRHEGHAGRGAPGQKGEAGRRGTGTARGPHSGPRPRLPSADQLLDAVVRRCLAEVVAHLAERIAHGQLGRRERAPEPVTYKAARTPGNVKLRPRPRLIPTSRRSGAALAHSGRRHPAPGSPAPCSAGYRAAKTAPSAAMIRMAE